MTNSTELFDIAEHLKTDKDIREFLIETSNIGDVHDLTHALNIAARAKGMPEVAKKSVQSFGCKIIIA